MEIQAAGPGLPPQPETAGAESSIVLKRRPSENTGLTYSPREVIKPGTGYSG